jgi:DNA-binding beta-propeller fold protein YncE
MVPTSQVSTATIFSHAKILVLVWSILIIFLFAITEAKTISLFAGRAYPTWTNGAKSQAQFWNNDGIALDSKNNLLYVVDAYNYLVRVINISTGIVDNFAGSMTYGFGGDNGPALLAQFNSPTDVAVDSTLDLVYIADNANHCIRVVNRTTGNITTFAGTCGASGDAGENVSATSGGLNAPFGVAVDSANGKGKLIIVLLLIKSVYC